MRRSTRRLLFLIIALPLAVIMLAALYSAGMTHLEGRPRDFLSALEWASETLTSTGYGADNHWEHPAMVVFVIVTQLVGTSMLLLVFPFILVPFFEERFEGRLPRKPPRRMGPFVLVYRWGPAVAGLVEELERSELVPLVFEEDESRARRLRDQGRTILYGSIDDGEPEARVLTQARAIVTNGSDHDNGALILSARQEGYEGPIYALAHDPFHRAPMMAAGATVVYTPAHILAAALAARASAKIEPRLAGLGPLEDLQTREFRITDDSPIAGQDLLESQIPQRTDAVVVGVWANGHFTPVPAPNAPLSPRDIVVAVGTAEALDRFGQLSHPLPADGPVVVAGYGEVGQKLTEFLRDAGETVIVMDREREDGVDIVGDILDAAVLRGAGVKDAKALIVALSSDAATTFATTVIRSVAPHVPVIARINRDRNINRIRRAGADFVLSVASVAGQLLSHHLLDRAAPTTEPRVRVTKYPGAGLRGRSPHQPDIRRRTNCAVVAVRRGELLVTQFSEGFRIQDDDTLYVCGTTGAHERFGAVFGGT